MAGSVDWLGAGAGAGAGNVTVWLDDCGGEIGGDERKIGDGVFFFGVNSSDGWSMSEGSNVETLLGVYWCELADFTGGECGSVWSGTGGSAFCNEFCEARR